MKGKNVDEGKKKEKEKDGEKKRFGESIKKTKKVDWNFLIAVGESKTREMIFCYL